LERYHVWLYILRKLGFEQLLDDVGFIPNLTHNAEKLAFHSFWNPSMHAQARVCMHMYRTCVRYFKDAYTYAHIRVHTLEFSMVFIFKIIHFNSKKSYIFPKALSSSQFQSNQILNQPWVLEFQHRWGTKVRVVRGTECGVYTQ